MTVQINSNYLENYSKEYAQLVCERFFSSRQFITGQDIIQLTNSNQVNFFIIKRLFEKWQEELTKLKSNPFFDYRDIAVHEALTQFMNVLSRRIKAERAHFEPLVQEAVKLAIKLACQPVEFYQDEIRKAPAGKINEYLKENKKYYKWHDKAVTFLIDKAGFGQDREAYLKAISANYQVIKDSLESVNLLLATLGDVKAFDLDQYITGGSGTQASPVVEENKVTEASFFESVEEETVEVSAPEPQVVPEVRAERPAPAPPAMGNGRLDAGKLKAHFSAESYKGMKGILGELSESLALNQRFMFTKELFDGNADLLKHALKTIDESGSFDSAVDLINTRYVAELDWDTNSEAVREFLQLVYRKFAD
ncbi:hypothetical protein DFQ04_3504 [Algoriphagus boseongensis]|uniref:Uncharacterized protein n=1 Tax=Algoriphagus boseongensis TaxID=1442587 RepID=A0A4R6T0K7_9BACT|nr:hypothetical protein [Algoriphagus boseongensis]TDQ13780.1 hypothetical protein DFQ04_3504 [Algoriphagus boseongensis]